jgi:hypothetical protein
VGLHLRDGELQVVAECLRLSARRGGSRGVAAPPFSATVVRGAMRGREIRKPNVPPASPPKVTSE